MIKLKILVIIILLGTSYFFYEKGNSIKHSMYSYHQDLLYPLYIELSIEYFKDSISHEKINLLEAIRVEIINNREDLFNSSIRKRVIELADNLGIEYALYQNNASIFNSILHHHKLCFQYKHEYELIVKSLEKVSSDSITITLDYIINCDVLSDEDLIFKYDNRELSKHEINSFQGDLQNVTMVAINPISNDTAIFQTK